MFWVYQQHIIQWCTQEFYWGRGLRQEFFTVGGGSTNSVEDRGQRERGSGGGSPLVRGSTQFASEWNPYSDWVVTDVFSMEMGIRLSFVKTLEFWQRGWTPKPSPSLGMPLPSSGGRTYIFVCVCVCMCVWGGGWYWLYFWVDCPWP
jgi:hypothetical protein